MIVIQCRGLANRDIVSPSVSEISTCIRARNNSCGRIGGYITKIGRTIIDQEDLGSARALQIRNQARDTGHRRLVQNDRYPETRALVSQLHPRILVRVDQEHHAAQPRTGFLILQGLSLQAMNIVDFTEKFFGIEQELRLFDDRKDGISWWDAVRYEAYQFVYHRASWHSYPTLQTNNGDTPKRNSDEARTQRSIAATRIETGPRHRRVSVCSPSGGREIHGYRPRSNR